MSVRQFEAVQFLKPMERGVNSPFLVLAEESGSNTRVPLVVKSRAGYAGDERLAQRELFCLMLARELGLKAVEPVIVDLPAGLEYGALDYRNHQGRDYVDMLEQSRGLNFATAHLGTDWKQWMATNRPKTIAKESLHAAYAFDAMMQNADRRDDNPNMLWKGAELVLLDFDKALGYTPTHRGENPWRVFLPMMGLSQHCLHRHLENSDGQPVSTELWDAFEEWSLENDGSELKSLMESAMRSPLDFAEVLDYVSALKSRIDDFFDYLSAHTKSL